jgi:hypothetical protein
VNSSIVYLIYYKNIYKGHNVPPPSTTIKIKGKKYIKNFKNSLVKSNNKYGKKEGTFLS